ncbi:MAG: NAD-dependent DNA ligase LigA, partial [Holosporales bacterium]|nr:NAD-dependent DNA ligase LigA [Holosporales bacterium]
MITSNPVENLSMLEANMELEFLKTEIKRHDDLYYNKATPELSDDEYDALRIRLNAIEKRFPELISDNSPSNNIGAPVSDSHFSKAQHHTPMLSLENAFSIDDVEKFFWRAATFLSIATSDMEFCGEQKIDGLSASIIYINGKIACGSTRGNGFIGENVTQNLITISDIPKTIPLPGVIEVRGEVYIRTERFNDINAERRLSGSAPFANPRNAAAGSLRQIDSAVTSSRHLQFFAYYMSSIDDTVRIETQENTLSQLRNLGFSVAEHKLCRNLEEIDKFYKDVIAKRDSLGYEIDGAVFKINSIQLQKRLGFSGRNPRHSVAFKFSASEAETTINKITLGVGRTGKITPVAIVNPVNLSGAVISRATLHNFDEIDRKNIAVGDTVLIARSGDVIPKIISVVRKSGNPKFEMMVVCPSCGAPIARREGGVDLYCQNRYYCSSQIVCYISYFVSKNCFDIVGLGERQIEEFYMEGRVKTAVDILRLREKESEYGELSQKAGWGIASANKLYDAIDARRRISLPRFITALAIPGIGETIAQLLADKFLTMELLMKADATDTMDINGIGVSLADEISRFFKEETNVSYIRALLQNVSINKHEPTRVSKAGGMFYRKTIVFTGKLSKISRNLAKQLATSEGAF